MTSRSDFIRKSGTALGAFAALKQIAGLSPGLYPASRQTGSPFHEIPTDEQIRGLMADGKISRAIKNFRFNDSPLFMLNNVEALGVPVRIGGTEAGGPIVVPAVKAKDFDFTSLSDAI